VITKDRWRNEKNKNKKKIEEMSVMAVQSQSVIKLTNRKLDDCEKKKEQMEKEK